MGYVGQDDLRSYSLTGRVRVAFHWWFTLFGMRRPVWFEKNSGSVQFQVKSNSGQVQCFC